MSRDDLPDTHTIKPNTQLYSTTVVSTRQRVCNVANMKSYIYQDKFDVAKVDCYIESEMHARDACLCIGYT